MVRHPGGRIPLGGPLHAAEVPAGVFEAASRKISNER